MSITHITSLPQLNTILANSKQKLTVIDFHATWCGPCRAIAPAYEALSRQYTNVNFLKCDVDQARDVSGAYKVAAMPTFIFLKGSSQVDMVRGADRGALENAVRKHSAGSTGAFAGKGHTLGGSSSTSKPAPTTAPQPALPAAPAFWKDLDPQAKVLVCLLGAYAVFWWLS